MAKKTQFKQVEPPANKERRELMEGPDIGDGLLSEPQVEKIATVIANSVRDLVTENETLASKAVEVINAAQQPLNCDTDNLQLTVEPVKEETLPNPKDKQLVVDLCGSVDFIAETTKLVKNELEEVYEERNRLVSLLAKLFPSGTAKTEIPGWDPEWCNCVYVDLPTGQCAWHYHDSQSFLFDGLLLYDKPWDGHTTAEKYNRIFDFNPNPIIDDNEHERLKKEEVRAQILQKSNISIHQELMKTLTELAKYKKQEVEKTYGQPQTKIR